MEKQRSDFHIFSERPISNVKSSNKRIAYSILTENPLKVRELSNNDHQDFTESMKRGKFHLRIDNTGQHQIYCFSDSG